jgi:hypothetical protein
MATPQGSISYASIQKADGSVGISDLAKARIRSIHRKYYQKLKKKKKKQRKLQQL